MEGDGEVGRGGGGERIHKIYSKQSIIRGKIVTIGDRVFADWIF